METMRYTERKKSSKGFVFGFLLFVAIGGSIIYLAIKTEPQPVVIGKNNVENNNSVVEENPLVIIYEEEENVSEVMSQEAIEYKVEDKEYSDTSNSKIKSEIVLPIITIDNEELTDLNQKIDTKYTELFSSLKNTMKSVENKFTYKVSYDTYENTVDSKRILSIKIFQRVIDDAAKKSTTEKIETYNIDLATKEVVKNNDIIPTLLGKDYKTIIRKCIKEYVIENKMLDEEEFTYSYTGLESFYIHDGNIHLILNEEDVVEKKYGVLDIVIKENEE